MADDAGTVGQDEIEALLQQAKQAGRDTPAAPAGQSDVPPAAEVKAASETPAAPSGGKEAASADAPSAAAKPKAAEEPADDRLLGQDEIERLLASKKKAAPAAPKAAVNVAAPAAKPDEPSIARDDMEFLLDQTEKALASVQEDSPLPSNIRTFQLPELGGAKPSTEVATFELIRDVDLDLRIELGRTHMHLEDILKLRKGSVVALDKLAGDPVDIYVNGRLIARGEVLVLNDNFCVRVAELITAEAAA